MASSGTKGKMSAKGKEQIKFIVIVAVILAIADIITQGKLLRFKNLFYNILPHSSPIRLHADAARPPRQRNLHSAPVAPR